MVRRLELALLVSVGIRSYDVLRDLESFWSETVVRANRLVDGLGSWHPVLNRLVLLLLIKAVTEIGCQEGVVLSLSFLSTHQVNLMLECGVNRLEASIALF